MDKSEAYVMLRRYIENKAKEAEELYEETSAPWWASAYQVLLAILDKAEELEDE